MLWKQQLKKEETANFKTGLVEGFFFYMYEMCRHAPNGQIMQKKISL